MDWEEIKTAASMIKSTSVNRIDGDGWKVYRVGKIVRIDIEEEE